MRPVGFLVLLLAAALAATSPAAAATLQTLSRCYQEKDDVVAAGSGFAPNSLITVTRDATNLGSAYADAAGAFQVRFRTPKLPARAHERGYDLVATDGANTAVVRYRATKLLADFAPGAGNLATLRVRFHVRGFNLLKRKSSVYLHYVRPNGKLRRTIRLGRARGTCGHILRTKRRRLFAFNAQRGRWTLQFDTRQRYERASATSKFVWVRRPVRVVGAGG
ncbi:MAG: hypothetical protein M3401_10065 [Actinomycetota bacterium]|nr:hypothetical protein [Actinomycetota bacterium]